MVIPLPFGYEETKTEQLEEAKIILEDCALFVIFVKERLHGHYSMILTEYRSKIDQFLNIVNCNTFSKPGESVFLLLQNYHSTVISLHDNDFNVDAFTIYLGNFIFKVAGIYIFYPHSWLKFSQVFVTKKTLRVVFDYSA